MKIKKVILLFFLLDILILAGAAAGQAAAPTYFPDTEIKEELLQVKYEFKIIEIRKEIEKDIKIEGIYDKDSKQNSLNFYSEKDYIEIIDPVSSSYIMAKYLNEKKSSQKIIKPEVVVSIFEKASIEVSEITLNLKEDLSHRKKLQLSLIPKKISVEEQEIISDLVIEVDSNSYFNTTIKLKEREEILAGFLLINETLDSGDSQNKLFAVYLQAKFIGGLDELDKRPVLSTGGLSKIISRPQIEENFRDNYMLVLIGENKYFKSNINLKSNYIINFLLVKDELINIGLGTPIFSELIIESNLLFNKENEFYLSLGLNEEINFNDYLYAGAGIYPLVYMVGEKDLGQYEYWVETGFYFFGNKKGQRDKILIKYQNRKIFKNLKVELHGKISEELDLLLANQMNLKGEDLWQIGFKLNF